MSDFRFLGIEREGAVAPGAHEFGRNFQNFKGRPSNLETHKMYFIYKVLDMFCWISGMPGMPQNQVTAKSPQVGVFVQCNLKKVSFEFARFISDYQVIYSCNDYRKSGTSSRTGIPI